MPQTPMKLMQNYGPDFDGVIDLAASRAVCDRIVRGTRENFFVLSRFVPRDRVADFTAVYAFCRWADDLGDESGSTDRALELLEWWRGEIERTYDGAARHPVFVALAPVIEQHGLPKQLFTDLVSAFEQDQRKTRYETWDELIEYCRLSANPVGQLVLRVLDQPRDPEVDSASDAICTALQLSNHWQDVGRDLRDRDRIYLPRDCHSIENFEERLRGTIEQGWAVDQSFLEESRTLIRELVRRTWPLYENGSALMPRLTEPARPIVWLFSLGGQCVLRAIEQWNYETVLNRPVLGVSTRLSLLVGTWLRCRLGRFGDSVVQEAQGESAKAAVT